MIGKLVGALFVALGLITLYLLMGINKRQPRNNTNTAVKKYRLAHEYENKGFSEKGQSEGILDIPPGPDRSASQTSGMNNDNISTPSHDPETPPGDTF
ncbi:hypothetical protein Q3R63_004403 [Salmonella enterica]|nr:hypothetical protein [Salmonella enterica subsp. enterica]EDV1188846.1 hypothetical protein [Salmonella enterica subsp. enterica]EHD0299388.1 hypothetical protein [Salmonella enterica subsp. enterica serovar Enteritidis]EJO8074282.1 hypothetical protein [Salmonella enterica]ELM1533868.1 hypothetical protein [Salmonella enterica]